MTAFAAKANTRPSIVLLAVFVVAAGAFVILSAFAASGSVPRRTLLPAALATVAFAIWSLSVPFSGWQRWSAVHNNQAVVALVAAGVAVAFSFVAEGLTKRYATDKSHSAASKQSRKGKDTG